MGFARRFGAFTFGMAHFLYPGGEKRRNEILKHSYERKAYLEARWVVLPVRKTGSDMETRHY